MLPLVAFSRTLGDWRPVKRRAIGASFMSNTSMVKSFSNCEVKRGDGRIVGDNDDLMTLLMLMLMLMMITMITIMI